MFLVLRGGRMQLEAEAMSRIESSPRCSPVRLKSGAEVDEIITPELQVVYICVCGNQIPELQVFVVTSESVLYYTILDVYAI